MDIFEAPPKIIRVLIADDHLALAEAVGNALCAPPRAFQTEIATNFSDAMKLLSNEHSFDLVILDVKMPGMIGLKSITDAITAAKPVPVLLMSGNPDRALVQLSVEQGGRGIIPKSLSLLSLVSLVDFVLTGQTFIPSADIKESNEIKNKGTEKLNTTEIRILNLTSEGLRNKEIASAIGVTEVTIKMHMRSICQKLGARNRAHSVMLAKERGII